MKVKVKSGVELSRKVKNDRSVKVQEDGIHLSL